MKAKPKTGRPSKYREEFNGQVEKLCKLGATDKEIADFFEIAESTLNEWKKDYPAFSESIKKGKTTADMKVAHSLFKRAVGFHFNEVTHEEIEIKLPGEGGKKVVQPATLKKVVRKLVVPDTTAQIFWLKNRKADKWRDKQEVDHTTGGHPFTLNIKPE